MQLFHRVFLYFLLIPGIHHYLYQLAQYIHTVYFTLQPALNGDRIPDIRQAPVQFLVGFFLILQAAHQPAAHT